MSENKKTLIDLVPDVIDNAIKRSTDKSIQNLATIFSDIGFLTFSDISQNDLEQEIQFITDPNEIENELYRRSVSNNNISSSSMYDAKIEYLKQFYRVYSSFKLNEEDIRQYLSIYEKLEIKSISNVTTNKCIIDPLGNPISDISNIKVDVCEVNNELLELLNKNPNILYQLSSRKFEEVIAEILNRKGYKVELTSVTRDGGKDIYAAHKTDLGSFLYIVECKKYNPNNKVGVSILRDLYGVVSKENATCGIIATTSYFTKPAKEFQQEIPFKMSLKDFDSIKQWLFEVT